MKLRELHLQLNPPNPRQNPLKDPLNQPPRLPKSPPGETALKREVRAKAALTRMQKNPKNGHRKTPSKVEKAVEKFNSMLAKHPETPATAFALYGKQQPEEQVAVFKALPTGRRKVVFKSKN